jgi:ribosomal-protein-alanine N-acetyltransferase
MEKLNGPGDCPLPVFIRPMAKVDIHQVGEIDREAFPTMWPPVNFNHELTNRLAHYIVASQVPQPGVEPAPQAPAKAPPRRSFWGKFWPFGGQRDAANDQPGESIAGFLGMWMMVDEAHIINIAVRATCRGRGVGELLLISGIDLAYSFNASVVTLEVRVSNKIAQNLYLKYGFSNVGVRKKYYTDNNEDALIMTTSALALASYRENFQKLKSAHLRKLEEAAAGNAPLAGSPASQTT